MRPCDKHKMYHAGNRRPTVPCEACWAIYLNDTYPNGAAKSVVKMHKELLELRQKLKDTKESLALPGLGD